MPVLRTIGLMILTAVAEIVGCFLVYRWSKHLDGPWVLIPAAASLGVFAWLLTLHPMPAGRTYAAYGGIYVATAVVWMWAVERARPDRWDVLGAVITVAGMGIIFFGPRSS